MSKPKNFPWVSPYLTVTDIDKAFDFYSQAFGFELVEKAKGENGETFHAEFTHKGQMLMLGRTDAYGPDAKLQTPAESGVKCPMNLYLYVDDVDAFYQHAVDNGAESITPPEDTFWGDRMCRLQDADGYVWAFATHSGE